MLLMAAALLTPGAAAAATYRVGSLTELQSRLDAASPGDVIIVRSGTYEATGPIVVRRAGAPGRAVRVKAQAPGSVEITGTAGFDVVSPAAYVEIDGFAFLHASGTTQIRPGAT